MSRSLLATFLAMTAACMSFGGATEAAPTDEPERRRLAYGLTMGTNYYTAPIMRRLPEADARDISAAEAKRERKCLARLRQAARQNSRAK